jgi:hypothetical protein
MDKLIAIAVLIVFSILYKIVTSVTGAHYFGKDFEQFLTFFAVIGSVLIVVLACMLLYGLLFGKKNEEKRAKIRQERTDQLVTAYKAATTPEQRDAVVKEFANKFGETERMLRARLSRRGVYIPKHITTDVLEQSGNMQHQQVSQIKDDDRDGKTRHVMNNDFTMSFNEIDDYTVVKGKTSAELVQNVKEKMRSGWQPFGADGAAAFGISPVGGNQYIQSMVKYRDRS